MKDIEITIILKQKLEYLPPISNLIDCLIDLGVSVNFICTEIDEYNYNRYKDLINIKVVALPSYRFRILKIFSIFHFRNEVYKFIDANNIGVSENSYIWLGSAEAAMGLGNRIANYKFIFQCHELYDTVYHYRFTNGFYFKNAVLSICPEENRSAIYRFWYNLNSSPYILANSPYYHPRKTLQPIANKYAEETIASLNGKKIILYMGIISPERDIDPFLSTIHSYENDFHFVVLGPNFLNNDYIKYLLLKYKKLSFIPSIEAPNHLNVASWAYIGILSYSFINLNNVFCAPNKIWEYSGFGIPVISNDIPGLQNLICKYNSGFAININHSNSLSQIRNALESIDSNYSEFSHNSVKMFNDYDYKTKLQEILTELL